MNRLEEILRTKRAEIERLRACAKELERQARARNDFHDFRAALQLTHEKPAVIAEVKKAWLSAGYRENYERNLRRVYSYAT
jgi:indole-3-glycerol phosphate synthase